MSDTPATPPALSRWQTFSAAPHRLFLWGGALFAAVAVAVWTVQQASLYTPLLAPFAWAIPYPQAHAFMMIYGLFAYYFFGFLLTTFPRWLDAEPVPRGFYVPAWLLVLAGTHGFWLALFIGEGWVLAACAALFGGYVLAILPCARILLRSPRPGKGQQVVICLGLAAGAAGIGVFMAAVAGGEPEWYGAARVVGLDLFLLPVVLTVIYRMVPFFTSVVTAGYELRRSAAALPAFLALLILRAVLEWRGLAGWLWVADGGLLLVLGREALRWRFWRAPPVPLLTVLYAGVGWICLAFLLSAGESLYVLATAAAAHPLGRAPLHALTVGGFGSLLIGISTRVTLGHSGRGLSTGPFTSAIFTLFQLVPLMRVVPELLAVWWPSLAVQGFWSGVVWAGLFAAWFLALGPVLTRPRSDGRPD